MSVFVGCIVLLYLLSFRGGQDLQTFSKDKVFALRGILAVLIVAHHLSFQTDLMSAFRPWGAPIVSLFLFISGYGLMVSYSMKGEKYLSSFVRFRIIEALLVPFLLAWALYRAINWSSLPGIGDAFWILVTRGIPTLPNSWYIFTIVFFYICFYCACKLAPKHILGVLSVLCIAYVFLVQYLDYDRCWYISALAFPLGVAYVGLEKRVHAMWKIPARYYATVPLGLLSMALCVYLKSEWAYLLFYLIFPLVMVCLCSAISVERLNGSRVLRGLSNVSYEVYLCQGIGMSLLRGDYFYVRSDLLYVFLTFLSTFILAYIVKHAKVWLVAAKK